MNWNQPLCGPCSAELCDLRLERSVDVNGGRVHGLFSYQGIVRELLLRAKTKNQFVAAEILFEAGADVARGLYRGDDERSVAVIPAPSSFWGRARGRYDVAGLACEYWFEQVNVYHRMLPGTFYRPKRAAKNSSGNSQPGSRFFNRFFNKTPCQFNEIAAFDHIVVVDDVLTSGFTMRSTFELLKSLGAQSLEGLVIAVST